MQTLRRADGLHRGLRDTHVLQMGSTHSFELACAHLLQ